MRIVICVQIWMWNNGTELRFKMEPLNKRIIQQLIKARARARI